MGSARRGRPVRRLLIDLTPVRRSRDLRCLVLGELVSPAVAGLLLVGAGVRFV